MKKVIVAVIVVMFSFSCISLIGCNGEASGNNASYQTENSEPTQEEIENAIASLNVGMTVDEEKVESVINEYYDYMNDEQKEECIASLGRYKALDETANVIKDGLISPSSFYMYSYEVWDDPVYDEEKDEYFIMVTIKYGAKNAFNAEVTDMKSSLVHYSVDVDNKSVSINSMMIA